MKKEKYGVVELLLPQVLTSLSLQLSHAQDKLYILLDDYQILFEQMDKDYI